MQRKLEGEMKQSCEILKEAEGELSTCKQEKERLEILQLAQTLALRLKQTFEKNITDSKKEVEGVVNYCQNIYRSTLPENASKEIQSELSEERLQVIELLKKKIEETSLIQVVFFPYKAEMWDAFESVWEAFQEKEDVSVKVVPIPYYSYDPASKDLVESYEIDRFPSYVEMTSYKDYDISLHRPDIGFIHNPFDGANRILSVHPDYYSSKLKSCIKKLVYIPYYLTGGTETEGHRGLPAYKYMDYIITQSEDMNENYHKLGIDKEKILPLGSPKSEAVYKASYKNTSQRIYRQEIKNRPVILLNTSISGILDNNLAALGKIQYIFQLFKEHPDIVLWWRPHPLLKSTIELMRQELKEKYLALIQDAENMENVIFDESPNVSDAVALSRAYIGEETSSMVHLFGIAGKPIFLLDSNQRIIDRDTDVIVETIDVLEDKDTFWFVWSERNYLCRMKKETGHVEIIADIQETMGRKDRPYRGILAMDEERLFLTPQWAQEEVIFNRRNYQIEKRKIGKTGEAQESNFLDGFCHNNKIYMIPTRFEALLVYDIQDDTYESYREVVDCLDNSYEATYFYDYTVVEDRYIYMPHKSTGTVVRFDMKSKRTTRFKINGFEGGFVAIDYDGETFWLAPSQGQGLVLWNPKSGVQAVLKDYDETYKVREGVQKILCLEDYTYIFPKKFERVLRIRRASQLVETLDLYGDQVDYNQRKTWNHKWPNNFYFVKKKSKTSFVAMRAYDGQMIIYDEKEARSKIIKPFIDNQELLKPNYMFERQGNNLPYALRETLESPLEGFIEWIASGKGLSNYSPEASIGMYAQVLDHMGNAGKVIAKTLLDLSKESGDQS